MEPTVRPKVAETQASRAARAAGKAIGNSVKAGFATAGVGAALAGSMAVASAAIPAAVGLAGALGVVAAAGKEVGETMQAYNKAQEAVTQGGQAAAEAQAEFARKFSELTAEGQAFTSQLISMGPAMDNLGDVAQSSVLPGFTELLQTSEELFPTIEHGLEAVGGALSDTASQAAVLAGSEAFQDDLWSAFDNGADITRALGGMMVDLTGDFVNFAGEAGPATEGMVDMVGSLSDGVSSFLSNALPGMESYGSILRSVGGILDSTLSTAGELMAMLGTEGAPTIERLEQAWSQLLGVVEQFASSGMGPLMSGFGTMLDVLSGLLAVLEPIAPLLGTITGAVLPFVAALKMVDKVTFGGVKKQLRGVGEAMDAAETKRSKFGAGMKGMIGSVLNPWGLAIGAAGLALSLLGQNQREAAEAAANHASAVQELTTALERDGGVVGDNTSKVIAHNLAQRKASEHARALGISIGTVTEAASGNQQAFGQLTGTIDKQIASVIRASDSSNALIDDIQGVEKAEIATSKATNDYIDDMSTWRMNSLDLSDAQRKQLEALLNLKGATWEQYEAAQEAKRIAQEQAAAQNGVTVETLKHWSALIKLNSELLKSVNKDLAYRQATLQLEQAQKRATEALDKHGKESIEYRKAAQAEEQQVMSLLQATYDKTMADKKSLPPQKRAIAATRSMQAEAFELAKTYEGPLPKALAQYIGGMSRSQAAAHGAELAINDAGQAVYELPGGKTVRVAADTGGFWAAMYDIINTSFTKTIDVMMQPVYSFDFPGRAKGGPVESGRPYVVGEKGPELIVPKRDGFVHTASQTAGIMARSAPQMSAGSARSMSGAAASSGGGVGGGRMVVEFAFDGADEELVKFMRKSVRVRGGNVQTVLGGGR